MKYKTSTYLIAIACLFTACTAKKFVPNGELLYTKPQVNFVSHDNQAKKSDVDNAINEIIRPAPNKTFLGMRPSLWIWYKFSKPNQSPDSAGFIKRKFGKPPVYLSQTNPDAVVAAINASLYNNGFFDSKAGYEQIATKKTATYSYTINLFKPYRIRQLNWPKDSSVISKSISADTINTSLKIKSRYKLETLVEERRRIDEYLKEQGFYYFNDKLINYKMDTTLGNKGVAINLYIIKDAPKASLIPYLVKQVNVYTNNTMVADTVPYNVVWLDSVRFFESSNYIRTAPIKRAIFFSSGRTYSRKDHNLTLSRLGNLGVFKFVNVKLLADSNGGFINANIELIPLPKKSISVDLTAASKSNNFMGPALNVRFRNRNAFKGAELLLINTSGGIETQFNGPFKGQYTFEINPKIELYFPRFFLPSKLVKNNSMFVPKTKFILDYSYTSRVNYFDLQSSRFSYGYKWKPSLANDHDLGLFNVTYFNVFNQSAAFASLLSQNIFLKQRFENQFIEGVTYNFMYNEQVKPEIKHPFFINLSAEVAGSLLGLSNIGNNRKVGETYTVFNVNYAQFARVELEVRKYFKFDKRNRKYVATRFLSGWGLPYGNSSFMPYVRQFFSGGAYSVRGFPSFSLGPGTYYPPASLQKGFFLQQGGEIKLEANAEYRFSFTTIFKGAFFIDAGNTWLNNANAQLPGAEFNFNSFYKQVAVGVGFGLRVDVQFFVVRLDLGVPVRKPWMAEGQEWQFNKIDLGNATWRRENLILNLAFGYPF